MNVFQKYTLRSLVKNKSRTVVTIIGIILSMAMFTAVVEAVSSAFTFMINVEVEQVGSYMSMYYGLDEESAKKAESVDGVKDSARWQEVGWADIGSTNGEKPYIYIVDADSNITDLVSVRLISGRMPENGNEIIIPKHLATNGGVTYKTGDTLTLSVGKRTADGRELTVSSWYEDGEKLTDTEDITYTVVGTYERLSYNIEEYSCPGYTAITAGGGRGAYSVFFSVKHPYSWNSFIKKNALDASRRDHRDMLRYYGSIGNESLRTTLYGFAAVLMFMIAFGSISLIYNSFSISVSDRTRQFGILKSIGATKKQIRSTVTYEALVLAGIAIPIGALSGCVGLGVTFRLLRGAFDAMLAADSNVKMKLSVSIPALIVAALVCLLTTLISAWIPARRAIKIPAMEAIRQTGDVKVSAKEVKTSKLTGKLFGFAGIMASKNFKRNKKRYRSVIISLFLSVTLFISASSFCSYFTRTVNGYILEDNSTDIYYYTVGEEQPTPEELFPALLGVNGVEKGAYYLSGMYGVEFDESAFSKQYADYVRDARDSGESGSHANCMSMIIFADDNTFREYCAENGLNADKFFDRDDPQAVMYNVNIIEEQNRGSSKRRVMDTIDKNKLPVDAYITDQRSYEEYRFFGTPGEVYGEECDDIYVYYPIDYVNEALENGLTVPDFDRDEIRIPIEETMVTTKLKVGALTEKKLFAQNSACPALIYPYSMLDAVVTAHETAESLNYETNYAFSAPEHAKAYEEMKNYLIENGLNDSRLRDDAEVREAERMIVTIVNVFSYGFITLISLISVANVFNTISTNVSLRRREFAMLRSIGMSRGEFRRMMNYECVIYGAKGLMYGLPASVIMTYIIYRITGVALEMSFYIPWYSILIAVGSVFAVVFATMLYATNKIKKDNTVETLRRETL